ncbi:MAG TPA: serine/threonine-protein kinase [Byssovorax sp.]|jgi:serine/threonine-protein kinase
MGLYDEPDELAPGRRLGRYELIAPIGEGGMGRVFAARMEGTRGFKKIVAVKTLTAAVAADPEAERALLNEAELASQIHHRNVVEVLDLGEERGTLFIVMEWVDGEPLHRVLRASGKAEALPFEIAARIAADAASGLHAAHELCDESGRHLALIHRDVSPQNILVAREGTVKVVDFGIAKALGLGGQATRTGELKGKISYMSPEQVTGAAVDRRSDVYALGVVLFEMITGTRPFVGAHEVQVLQLIAQGRAPSPRSVVQHCPPELEHIVMTALARDPVYRFATAEVFSLALEEFLARNGRVVTSGHVAALVRDRCGARMDAARRRITSVGGAPPASLSQPPPSQPRTGDVPVHTPSANHVNLATPAITGPTAQARSGAMVWAFVGAAVLLAGSATLFALSRRSTDAAAVAARSAVVALHVTPASARVVVGGALAGAGDQSVARPATGAHTRVVVSAEGYATSTIDLSDDAPETVSVDLLAVAPASSSVATAQSAAQSANVAIPEVHVDAPRDPRRRGGSSARPPDAPSTAGVTVPKNPY